MLAEALQRLWTSADGHAKNRLSLALATVAVGSVSAALTPLALKLSVDTLAQARAASALLSPALLVMLYVCGHFLSRSLMEVRALTFGQAEQRLRRRISAALFEHVIRLPLQFHLDRKAGAIGEIAEQGMRGYQLLLTHMVHTILPVAIEFVVVAGVLLHYDYGQHLAIVGASAAAYLFAFHRASIDVRAPARTASERHIEARGVLTDALINSETVKYFDAELGICQRYGVALERTEGAWRTFLRCRAINGLWIATIFTISLGWSLIWAAADVLKGMMTVGGFVLVNAYIIRLVQPLEMLGLAVRDVAQGTAFLEKLLDLFRERPEDDRTSRDVCGPPIQGELAFDCVRFSYHEGRSVLKEISFTVPAGHTVAIVGTSGSGKSSVIKLLFRLYEPDGGQILLDGTPISEMPLSMLRQSIAVVPQDTVLFHDTIERNIGFGRIGSSRWEIEEAARVADLHEFIVGLPEEYETVVGERGLKLSGGERQRIAIARAAIKRPRIFVFDEATSSLDTKTERAILHNLIDVSRQATTLVIAHRLSTVVHADEILVLNKGVIVERGNHHSLLERQGHYAALWHAQQGQFSQETERGTLLA